MRILREAQVPFLVGGAYALCAYTGIARRTKDFDLFIKPNDVDRALAAFEKENYDSEKTYPHWLAKASRGDDFIDLIFRAGNGVCEVDELWFEHAREEEVLGVRVKVCAPEETLWLKAYIMERERYDGADVVHILQSCAQLIDWARVLERFGEDWRVLLSHLVLFGYVYPGERNRIPQWVMAELTGRLTNEHADEGCDERICRGTLLSRAQYLWDVHERGYRDGRLHSRSHMTEADIAHWTAAIGAK